jgi:hypothetical protein
VLVRDQGKVSLQHIFTVASLCTCVDKRHLFNSRGIEFFYRLISFQLYPPGRRREQGKSLCWQKIGKQLPSLPRACVVRDAASSRGSASPYCTSSGIGLAGPRRQCGSYWSSLAPSSRPTLVPGCSRVRLAGRNNLPYFCRSMTKLAAPLEIPGSGIEKCPIQHQPRKGR